jgi:NADPH:quinone reductase-like Zn-dependent oxidoreductase
MKAARILQFGPPSVIVNEDMERPKAGEGQLLVQVKAAGVGPWDALIREGKSTVSPAPPLILGSDLAGIVAEAGTGVFGFKAGDEVYGSTNDGFVGAYAEYALASAAMMAPKPRSLNFLEAASAPVVAVTAWQMLFDYAHAQAGQTVLILGAGGNVGAYAVQLARNAGLNVIATASANDVDYVRGLGANMVFDYHRPPFEDAAHSVDAVIDTVGGTTSERSLRVLKPGGILVSAVSPVPEETTKRYGVKAVFFYVEVTTSRLQRLTELFDSKKLVPCVGTVLPLSQARVPHDRGKIVLKIAS